MNVQIGDTVLVTETSGFVLPAMVLRIWANSAISCAGFSLGSKETLRYERLPYAESIKTLEGSAYWDFRPSQKESEKTQAERFEGWKNPFSPVSTAEIKNQDGIKLHPSLLKPPVVGTFEWALVALKNGHKVRKLGWYEPDAAVKIDHSIFRLLHSGCLFIPSSHDLLATDWVLA